MKIAIIGAGPTGLVMGIGLARRGHQVVAVDRDGGPAPDGSWPRKGVMQFHHAHGFRPQIIRILQREAPAAWENWLAAGASRCRILMICGRKPWAWWNCMTPLRGQLPSGAGPPSRSTATTWWPRSASPMPMTRPVGPAPMMAIFIPTLQPYSCYRRCAEYDQHGRHGRCRQVICEVCGECAREAGVCLAVARRAGPRHPCLLYTS